MEKKQLPRCPYSKGPGHIRPGDSFCAGRYEAGFCAAYWCCRRREWDRDPKARAIYEVKSPDGA
jgi:hypothetical protein